MVIEALIMAISYEERLLAKHCCSHGYQRLLGWKLVITNHCCYFIGDLVYFWPGLPK